MNKEIKKETDQELKKNLNDEQLEQVTGGKDELSKSESAGVDVTFTAAVPTDGLK